MKANYLLLVQGGYTTLTGAWPLIHMKSFVLVTGPKHDLWLVKTVALLLVCMGLSFLYSIAKSENTVQGGQWFLSLSSAIALASVDIYYFSQGVISKVYLLDAVMQICFIVGWILIFTRHIIMRRRELINFVS